MFSNYLTVEYNEFIPDLNLKDRIQLLAERLQERAPSDANVKFSIGRHGKSIKVICRIVSTTGTFISEAIGNSVHRATDRVEFRMHKQLKKWKSLRFIENGSL